jgi:hypothetical protein
MSESLGDSFDIHSESVLTIRRTLIAMSVLLLSFDYSYFSFPDTLTLFQVKIIKVTSWHVYATAIALLTYVLFKYLAKLRGNNAAQNNEKLPPSDYWIKSEILEWEKYFNSQVLSYLNRNQASLEVLQPKVDPGMTDRVLRTEIKNAQRVRAQDGGAYVAQVEAITYYVRKDSTIVDTQPCSGEVGPISINLWRRCLMSVYAWFWYICSDHFIIEYFPIVISFLALAKFTWLYFCK